MPARAGAVRVLRMATKTDFTEQEWEALQKGVTGAGMFVSISQPGFTDTFSEANALAKHLAAAHEKSDSALIRDIATAHGKPFGITDSPGEIEQKTTETLNAAVAALQAKAPEEIDNYRQLVLDVAQSVAEAAKGVSDKESDAVEKIRAALG
jgi:hypothetical protein